MSDREKRSRFPDHPKVGCRTPAKGREGVTNIPEWKFNTLSTAILDELKEKGDVAWGELTGLVTKRLSDDEKAHMGNIGWFTVTVKLELEVRGEIERVPGTGPQRIRLAD